MKVLVAGDWHSELHEEPIYQAFKSLGHDAQRFPWHQYFKITSASHGLLAWVERLSNKIQNRFMLGPLTNRLNEDLLRTILEYKPDVVFVYRGTHIYPETLKAAKKEHPSIVLIGYNNDDPYAKGYPSWLWRHFIKSIPEYDIVLAYRHHNLDDFRKAGAKRVELLRSWFIPERNHPVVLSPEEIQAYSCDVVFVGHYEADGRLEMLEEVVKAGFHLRLYGPGYDWDPVLRRSNVLKHLIPVRLVWGEEYNKALGGAKIALCFFSKLNRDTYTRRCFEIPASGTMMLSEYTDDAESLFPEGVSAEYFRSRTELVEKIRTYTADDQRRTSIAAAGREQVVQKGHDVLSRMRSVIAMAVQVRSLQGGYV